MAYIYLLDLYKNINTRLAEMESSLAEGHNTTDRIAFLNGRKDVLTEFHRFLNQNLDQKLPKRIRKQLAGPEG